MVSVDASAWRRRWRDPCSVHSYVDQCKVFGLTTTSGEMLVCHVPKTLDAIIWAKIVDRTVGPFMKNAYPDKRFKTILLDP